MMEPIVASAIYCDDIRHELGGKLSFMGVYNSEVVVPEFPGVMHKLCVFTTVRIPVDTQVERLAIRLKLDDIDIAENALPEEYLEQLNGPLTEQFKRQGDLWKVAAAVFEFLSLQLTKESNLTLHITVGDREIRGNGLKIRQNPSVSAVASLG